MLTITTLQNANVSIEICPNSQGFVQCYTPLVTGVFPQTYCCPTRTGPVNYLIDGVALFGNQSKAASANYTVDDTMFIQITADQPPRSAR